MVIIYATSKHFVYVPNVILSILMLCVCELQSACLVFHQVEFISQNLAVQGHTGYVLATLSYTTQGY